MDRDITIIAKEIDWTDFFNKMNIYNIKTDLDIKTWDNFVLKIFPKLFFFNSSFLENKQLTSLNGCPKEFPGGFNCSVNELTSLEGAPEKVGGDFKCAYNKLTSLEGAPMEIGEYFFYLGNNNLPRYKVAAYEAYLELSYPEKAPLTKDGHYCPTDDWENQFK